MLFPAINSLRPMNSLTRVGYSCYELIISNVHLMVEIDYFFPSHYCVRLVFLSTAPTKTNISCSLCMSSPCKLKMLVI